MSYIYASKQYAHCYMHLSPLHGYAKVNVKKKFNVYEGLAVILACVCVCL